MRHEQGGLQLERPAGVPIKPNGAATLAARLDGRLLTDQAASDWKLSLHGTGASDHRIELDLASGSIARIYVVERLPGLPAGAGGARPAHTPLSAMTMSSDMLVFR